MDTQSAAHFPALPTTAPQSTEQQPTVTPQQAPQRQTPEGMIHISDLSKVLTTFAEGLAGLLGHKIEATQLQALMESILGEATITPATRKENTTMETLQITAEIHFSPPKPQ